MYFNDLPAVGHSLEDIEVQKERAKEELKWATGSALVHFLFVTSLLPVFTDEGDRYYARSCRMVGIRRTQRMC